jgi:ankyrin repeat protein
MAVLFCSQIDFNLKERNTENTPLMIAAEHGHDEVMAHCHL